MNLQEIVSAIEILHVNFMQHSDYLNFPTVKLLETVITNRKTMKQFDISRVKKDSVELAKELAILLYVSNSEGVLHLDFEPFTGLLQNLAKGLFTTSDPACRNAKLDTTLKQLSLVLINTENKNKNANKGVAFRVIRLLIICVIFTDFVTVNILSDFLLGQLDLYSRIGGENFETGVI